MSNEVENDLIPVDAVGGVTEATMRRAFLASYGIPVVLRSPMSANLSSNPYPLTVGPLGEVTLLVPADRAEEARELLKTFAAGDLVAEDDEPYDDSEERDDETEDDEDDE